MKIKINEYEYPKEIESCSKCPFIGNYEKNTAEYLQGKVFCLLGSFNNYPAGYDFYKIIHKDCKINN